MESKLEYIKFEKKEKEEEKIKLSVASYNQLGNSLGEEEHFKYVESKYLNSEYNCAANVLFGAMIRAGRWVCSMTCAMVKVLPDPVTPRSTWSVRPSLRPATSSLIAFG